MTTLRAAAQQALEALEFYPVTVNHWKAVLLPAAQALRAALAEPETPPEAQTEAEKIAYCAGWWDALVKAREAALAEPQEPYTGDVTRIIREAGMTFHLGLPHKPVIEQMSRVVDLVYAEASIKAAQQFAAPPQRSPLTDEEATAIARVGPVYAPDGVVTRTPTAYRRELEQTRIDAIRRTEAAHGIKDQP